MVTLARLQPGSKVQDRVRDKAGASVQIIFRAVAFFLRDQFISCRIAVVLPLRVSPGPDQSFMKPRFEPDVAADASENHSEILIDPEAYDASEQQFAASLEANASRSQPRFIVEDELPKETEPGKSLPAIETIPQVAETEMPAAAQAEPEQAQDPDAWRHEVAERLNHYRARRRTREPRYPSLQLKFEPEPNFDAPAEAPRSPAGPAMRQTADYVPSAAAPRITLAEPATIRGSCPPHHGNHGQGHRVCQLQPRAASAGRAGRAGARSSQNHRSSGTGASATGARRHSDRAG